MITAFDADVLIYAASPGHPLGQPVTRLFEGSEPDVVGLGSVLLLTEVLAKPMRDDPNSAETKRLVGLMSRLELVGVDESTARIALSLSISYGLRAADARHLACALVAGAERFLTNNRNDFPKTITEIDIVYPEDLA